MSRGSPQARPGAACGLSIILPLLPLLALLAGDGCRFQDTAPQWIEAHDYARVSGLAAMPAGVMAVGAESRLYQYPTDWNRPWRLTGALQARAIAASSAAVYVITLGGEVARVADGAETTYAGSLSWGATALAASWDDQLFVLVGGHVRRVVDDALANAPCGDVVATSLAAFGADDVFVVNPDGALYHGAGTLCSVVPAPLPSRDVAAIAGRVLIVGGDGSVWRRRGDRPWQALPPLRKYRPPAWPVSTTAAHVTASLYGTWVLDVEGNVFLLSDET
jgi:hypothetical protein